MQHIFIELQRAAGLSNPACAHYLGLSEGAVKDRKDGRAAPRKGELIALAIKGSEAEIKAKKLISNLFEESQYKKKPKWLDFG